AGGFDTRAQQTARDAPRPTARCHRKLIVVIRQLRSHDVGHAARDRLVPGTDRGDPCRSLARSAYLMPTMMIVNEPGTALPRPAPRPVGGVVPAGGGGGGGSDSEAIANRWPVLLSKA